MDSSNCNENKIPKKYEIGNIEGITVVVTEGETVRQVMEHLPQNVSLIIDNAEFGYRACQDDYLNHVIDINRPIYFGKKSHNLRYVHMSVTFMEHDVMHEVPGPMLASELIQCLQDIISQHGDVMVTIADTDGADREYPIAEATFITKDTPTLFQDRIVLE